MAFFCINCKSNIDAKFKACPFCGEPITDFLRTYLEKPIDGKYQIISRLGVGGMGEVYKVLHIHLNSVRVVKLMRPQIAGEESSHDRFVREARLATRIHHPNVATLFDFATLSDGSYYMVWEYIEGTNLLEVIRARGCLSPRYAAQIAVQGLMGLDAIHRTGIVHRDVSPENMMITRDDDGEENVKIIDLGIAKQWGDTSEDKTKTGMFVGKWKYCSPEHLGMLKEGERIDGRADLYSYGVVMYEMLTGTPPFIADTPHRYLLLHATENPKPLAAVNPKLNAPELESVIFKALEKDRTKRFATAREFAKALEALIPKLDDTAAVPPAIEYRDEPTEERKQPNALAMLSTLTSSRPALGQQNIATVITPGDAKTVLTQAGVRTNTEETALPSFGDVKLGTRTQLEETPGQSRNKLWIGGVLGVAATAAFVFVMASRHEPATDIPTKPLQQSAATSTMVVATPENGRVGVNAFPWGEVVSVRDVATGRNVELHEKLLTPLSLDLPPGKYEVTLSNPAFTRRVTQVVDVTPGENKSFMLAFEDSRDSYPDFGGAGR